VLSDFERFVAFRYLWGAEGHEEGRSFLRFVTYVAIGGVATGVAALLLSLAIVRGFGNEITEKILGFGAHIRVQSYLQDEPLSNARTMQRDLMSIEGVASASPVLEGVVLVRRSAEDIDGVVLLGSPDPPPYFEDQMQQGRFRPEEPGESPSLVVGSDLAHRLGLEVGTSVTVFSLRRGEGEGQGALRRPGVQQFTVSGIYETSLSNIDDTYIFANIKEARDLLDVDSDAATRFNVRVQNQVSVDSLVTQIEETFGFPIAARSIYDVQPFSSLFAWVNLQQSIIPVVIGVIVVVAAFNIIGTLLMMILEKTREVGVLQSLGASRQGLKRLFLLIGVLIGVVGSAMGSVVAYGLAFLQLQFEVIPLPEEAYYMSTAPIELNPIDFLMVNTVAIVLCALAAYIPARVAAKIEPVRAIRFQ